MRRLRARPDPVASSASGPPAAAPATRTIVAALSALAGAWIAAGSTGLLAHPLRHALSWVALAVLLIAAWPAGGRTWKDRGLLALAVAAAAAAAMTVPASSVVNVLAVALVAAVLARRATGHDRRLLLLAAQSVVVLAVYRLALIAIPSFWHSAQLAGRWLGDLAGWLAGRPLAVGATFGGLDFLVLMAAVCAGWLARTASPRWPRALIGAAAIVSGQLVYLVLLACAMDLSAALPASQAPPPPVPYEPPPWFWSDALRTLLPWNMPLMAAVIHLVVAAAMFSRAVWAPAGGSSSDDDGSDAGPHSPRLAVLAAFAPIGLAAAFPWVAAFGYAKCGLSDRTIVAYDGGRANWDKPVYDRFGRASAGMYGMLPVFVESLGGRFVRSKELAAEDLAQADVLLVIHPARPWTGGQLERVWEFVRRGGAALVVAEPWREQADLPDRLNELLEPTGMEVRFDTALPATAHWEHALEAVAHPAAIGLGDGRNRVGVSQSASIRAAWPVWPILVGRFGWCDPGPDALLTGVRRYDAGETLGDVVLAAERPMGRGRVAVLADPFSLTNEGMPNAYQFPGRLLQCLAGRPAAPQAAWRQALALLGCAALVCLMVRRPAPDRLGVTAVVLAVSFGLCAWASGAIGRVVPDGRIASPNNLALIDGSHLEASSGHLWHDNGLAGLQLNLMRNGYLPLVVPRLDAEQLDRAAVVVSIAPSRSFSASERRLVREFVDRGGVFIATVGADRAAPLRPLLADFDLDLPEPYLAPDKPIREPAPIGRYPPLNDDETYVPLRFREPDGYEAEMVFYARWPIECLSEHVTVWDYEGRPAVAVVRSGQGRFALLGDTAFAMNKNLEDFAGEPMAGMRENSGFWRWLLARTTDRPELLPKTTAAPAEAKPEPRPEPKPRPKAKRRLPNAPVPGREAAR